MTTPPYDLERLDQALTALGFTPEPRVLGFQRWRLPRDSDRSEHALVILVRDDQPLPEIYEEFESLDSEYGLPFTDYDGVMLTDEVWTILDAIRATRR